MDTLSLTCPVCKISDTSKDKLLADEDNQDIKMGFKWARKSSVATRCKGNTYVL